MFAGIEVFLLAGETTAQSTAQGFLFGITWRLSKHIDLLPCVCESFVLWNLSLDGAITFGFPNLNQRGFVIAAERTVDTFIYILITAGAVASGGNVAFAFIIGVVVVCINCHDAGWPG